MFGLLSKITKLRYFLCSYVFAHFNYNFQLFRTDYFKINSSIGWQWAYYDKINMKTTGKNKGIPFPAALGTIVNHPETIDFDIYEKHSESKDIYIGNKCWIGMNAVVLPGVVLGDNTIDGTRALVTKSFPEGNCVLAGVLAKLVNRV